MVERIVRQLAQANENLRGNVLRACLYDPGQTGRDAYRDLAHNTNSNECLYDEVTYLA